METWKDIPDYEGLYQASDLGNVKSLAKKWIVGKGAIRTKGETILKPALNNWGYKIVVLCKDGKMKSKRVNRLVWEAFNGKTDLQIDHIIEGDKTDNRLCNLQVLTNRQNVSKNKLLLNKSSQYTGVCWDKKHIKWKAAIVINSKLIHLGRFDSEIDAHNAYQNKLKSLI